MVSISRTTEVAYSADRMYALVNDVEAYPEFMEWCNSAFIFTGDETSLTATLSLSVGGISKTFTTRNTMQPGRRIDIHLLEGPFKYLKGCWLFDPVGEESCRVSIRMEFEFRNKVLKLALDKMFSHIINSIIGKFVDRARQVYGGN